MVDPRTDASRLKSAFVGLGTDNSVVIDIFANRSKEQLAAIAMAYHQMHSKTLEHDLKSETSLNFEKLLLGLST
jgi:7-cyano-7-deazaguanine synthase in queuosine biosynthesis